MPVVDTQAIANYSATRIVDALAGGSAVCVLTALALRVSRHQSAAARFAVCFLGLLAIAVFPLTRGLWTSLVFSKAGLQHPTFVVPESWAVYLFVTWAVLAALHLLGVGKALLHLGQLRRSGVPVDLKTLDPLVRQTLQKGIKRKGSLYTSDRVRVPTAIGLVRPAILIPAWAMEELSATELHQVLLHEMAHLRRYDDWTNLAQQLVRAVFFFHPAVWWIGKKMAFERELACDEAVLAATESPREYAECLTHLAERSFVQRSIALAQAALGRLSETSQRVAQILDGTRAKGTMWKPALSAAAGIALVCGLLVSESPEWIAFRDSAPQFATAQSGRGDAALPTVPVTMASYDQKAAQASYAKFTPQVKHAAKVQRQLTPPRTERRKPISAGLIHLASAKAAQAQSGPATETLFVVIESRDPNAPEMYQIQMWRVTVLRTQADPSTKPPKKT